MTTPRVPLRASLAALAALAALALSPAARAAEPLRTVQVVEPGQSIQWAIDHAAPGGWVYVQPGTYRETADPTSGLVITRSVNLVGRGKVVLENSGGQKNGIAAVEGAHRSCMDCHTSLAPPFPVLPKVGPLEPVTTPSIKGLRIEGITMKDFANNGLFTRGVEDFAIVDVHSVGNKNYGIFPVSSRNGIITRSSAVGADDSGIWVETSEHVEVTHNLVEGNVNGFEISNSEDILVANNEVRGNTVGIAALFLPDIFAVRGTARRITIRDNHVHDNNKPNTAREGAILSTVPPGTGILHLGVDDSLITGNVVVGNDFVGIAVVDYCAAVSGGPFDCALDPDVVNHPGFLPLSEARDNRVEDNVVQHNGGRVDPAEPFAFATSDVALLTVPDAHGNCFAGNVARDLFVLYEALALPPPASFTLPACP
jgi:parallel beta-helix repeat protein